MTSDLDELEAMVEANAFGYQKNYTTHMPHNGFKEFCGRGHLLTGDTTRFYKYRGKLRRVCRLCDRIRQRDRR